MKEGDQQGYFLLEKTEMQQGTANPEFDTLVDVDLGFSHLKVMAYDVDNSADQIHLESLIGSVQIDMTKLSAQGGALQFPFRVKGEQVRSAEGGAATLVVAINNDVSESEKVIFRAFSFC